VERRKRIKMPPECNRVLRGENRMRRIRFHYTTEDQLPLIEHC
jgi:hypothetical protein